MMRFFRFSLLLLLTSGRLFLPSKSASDEVSALAAFKKDISEDPLSKLCDWNVDDKDPCSWSGVECLLPYNRVISLRLSNSSLRGFMAPELGSLSYLQELILDNNFFLGSIPKEIGMLQNLAVLDLSVNLLSGPIPVEFGGLTNIAKIDLHSNRFSGAIPTELGNLTKLVELRLNNNRLNGVIPGSNDSTTVSSNKDPNGLCDLTRLTDLDLSYNFLVGEVPTCLQRFQRSSFTGNCFQDNSTGNRPKLNCANNENATNSDTKGGHKQERSQPLWLLTIEVISGATMVLLLITCSITNYKRCTTKPTNRSSETREISWKDNIAISIDDNLMDNVPKLSWQELAVACEDFSNIIGSSNDAIVYKGTAKNGNEIAVVSLTISANRWTNYLELYFQNEVAELARLNHENVAKLLGYCKECDPFSRMLLFEYASNGTLYEHLHDGNGCQLTWPRRMKIALSIARALRYMHMEMQPPFTVANLTSNTIYLTEDFSPKIIDFQRWRYLQTKPVVSSDCIVKGDSFHSMMNSSQKLYMDIQANTFAFGIILLELITGRPAISKDTGDFVDWAREYLDHPREISKLPDPQIQNVNLEHLSIISNVISICIEPEPSKRPFMNLIAAMLEDGIDISAAAILKDCSLAWAELED